MMDTFRRDLIEKLGEEKLTKIEKAPALSPRVHIAAAKQADGVLEFVAGK